MSIDELLLNYADEVATQATHPFAHGKAIEMDPRLHEINYLGKGLCTEGGEAGDVTKKIWRLNEYPPREELRGKLVAEMGDVLWYYVRLMDVLDITWHEIVETNQAKLRGRIEDGTHFIRTGDKHD